MSDKEQTAVDWLFKQLWDEPKDKFTWYAILKQAKTKHEEEMKQTYFDGWHRNMGNRDEDFEQYYNETYGKDE